MHNIIDTHIHSWDFERARYSWLDNDASILNRNYHIEELEGERVLAGVTGGIMVQAANNEEDTDYMLEIAESTPWIKGVVGWLPLTEPAMVHRMLKEKYLQNKYFKGVRHLIHDEPDSQWLLQPTVIESLAILADNNLSYDIVGVKKEHIETALVVAGLVPGLKLIFDHCNKPPIGDETEFGEWAALMKMASLHPNFYVKISGLGYASQKPGTWTATDIEPGVAFVLEHFGADRCCCGGDWPVSLLAGSYMYTWNNYKEVLSKLLNEADREKVLSQNAVMFYNL